MYTKTNQPSICFLQSALHIADKFHLIKNMSERFTKLIGENYSDYRYAIRESQAVREELKNNELNDFGSIQNSTRKDSRMIKFIEVKELQLKGCIPFEKAILLGLARLSSSLFCKM